MFEGCPPNFVYLNASNSCYQLIFKSLSWTSSRKRCEQLCNGCEFAVISDSSEHTAVASYLNKTFSGSSNQNCIVLFVVFFHSKFWLMSQVSLRSLFASTRYCISRKRKWCLAVITVKNHFRQSFWIVSYIILCFLYRSITVNFRGGSIRLQWFQSWHDCLDRRAERWCFQLQLFLSVETNIIQYNIQHKLQQLGFGRTELRSSGRVLCSDHTAIVL